jgi:hypothetical protein
MLFLSEPVVTCGFYTNQKLLLFIRSTFLQCADAKRVQLIYQQLYLSGCSTFALDGPRLLCYISDLVHHYRNKISIRVRFLFVFLQFPLSNENHPTQITFTFPLFPDGVTTLSICAIGAFILRAIYLGRYVHCIYCSLIDNQPPTLNIPLASNQWFSTSSLSNRSFDHNAIPF